jgi:hypothetical protein
VPAVERGSDSGAHGAGACHTRRPALKGGPAGGRACGSPPQPQPGGARKTSKGGLSADAKEQARGGQGQRVCAFAGALEREERKKTSSSTHFDSDFSPKF